MARKDNQRRVASLLVTSGPLSARDIATLTGLAYNTVRKALDDIGAVSDEGWPAEWSIAEADTLRDLLTQTPSLATTENVVLVDLEERDDWVEAWNKSIPRVAKLVNKLQIFPEDDPRVLLEQLKKILVPMAGLAYQLEQHKDAPDWFTVIGGNSDTEQVS